MPRSMSDLELGVSCAGAPNLQARGRRAEAAIEVGRADDTLVLLEIFQQIVWNSHPSPGCGTLTRPQAVEK